MSAIFQNWQAWALASAVFAALTALFGKLGVSKMNSDLATFIRTVVILVLAAAIVTARKEWVRPQSMPMSAIVFLVLSGLATGMSWLCYYRALQIGDASRVAPIDKLSVVLVVILAALFLGEKITWQVGAGVALITIGAILVALPAKG